jgi:hypothetical protein
VKISTFIGGSPLLDCFFLLGCRGTGALAQWPYLAVMWQTLLGKISPNKTGLTVLFTRLTSFATGLHDVLTIVKCQEGA